MIRVKPPILDRDDTDPDVIAKCFLIEEAGSAGVRSHGHNVNGSCLQSLRLQPLLDRREQILVLTEPLRLPSLHADPIRLGQVFINLLSNASKYSPLGQKIDLGIDVMGDQLLIAVADRGPGIPEAERGDIFEHFTRLAVEDTDQYGAGLGLSVVKSVIEGHGGAVSIDDRPGGGSIFVAAV